MNIEERVQQVLEEKGEAMSQDAVFSKLKEFYEEMQRLGLAQKHEYDLPPLDTGGRRLYEMTESKSGKDWPKPRFSYHPKKQRGTRDDESTWPPQ